MSWFVTFMKAYFSQCQCGHTINNLNTHLLWCPNGSECTTTHNTFQNTITSIVLKSGAHVYREVSHLFPCHTRWWMDIFITRDGFQILMDVVNVDLTCTNPDDEWIFLSLETMNGCCQCWFDLHKYGAMSINHDNMHNDDNYLGKYIIIHLTNIRRWLHSLCYWHIWVFSLSFWFIFYYLCIDHYHTSLLLLMLVFYY